jgi:hypothetical protein
VSATPEDTGDRWDRERPRGGRADGGDPGRHDPHDRYPDDRYPDDRYADRYPGDAYADDRDPDSPPLPRGARVIRTVAVIAVVIAALVGIAGVWRTQTSQVAEDKLAERHAHERAYSQLAGDPSGPGAARVENVTVTDAQIVRSGGSAAGTLVFTVYNSGELTRIRSVHVTVGGAPVSRVLYVPRPGADPAPLPGDGVVLGRHTEVVFAPDRTSFALIGLPAGPRQRADVVLTVDGVGRVELQAPVRDTGVTPP